MLCVKYPLFIYLQRIDFYINKAYIIDRPKK